MPGLKARGRKHSRLKPDIMEKPQGKISVRQKGGVRSGCWQPGGPIRAGSHGVPELTQSREHFLGGGDAGCKEFSNICHFFNLNSRLTNIEVLPLVTK